MRVKSRFAVESPLFLKNKTIVWTFLRYTIFGVCWAINKPQFQDILVVLLFQWGPAVGFIWIQSDFSLKNTCKLLMIDTVQYGVSWAYCTRCPFTYIAHTSYLTKDFFLPSKGALLDVSISRGSVLRFIYRNTAAEHPSRCIADKLSKRRQSSSGRWHNSFQFQTRKKTKLSGKVVRLITDSEACGYEGLPRGS